MRTALTVTVLLIAAACFAGAARGRTPPAAGGAGQGFAAPVTPRMPWSELDPRVREELTVLLEDPNWPIRVFALLRLERYGGDEPAAFVRQALIDPAWQARCFAIRQARRMNIEIDPELLKDEMDPRVLRAALRHGVAIPADQLKPHALRLLKTRGIEELMLGLELAACSDVPELREDGAKRAVRLIRNMDDAVALLIARRLALAVGLHTPPENAREWRAWLASKGDKITLAEPDFARRVPSRVSSPLVAEIDDEIFTRLLDYLSSLRQRDLELVIVMDATASMIPMVNSVRAGVDALILFLSDISRSMRLGFVAYRDRDNLPIWDGHPFTTDITSIRKYLFELRITGGADLPEAVLDGLTACAALAWNKQAEREIVLVGDAPPHAEDMYKVYETLDSFRNLGITVHAVHVPMEHDPSYYARLDPARADQAREELAEYNRSTSETFQRIADSGGGKKTELTKAEELVPSIMHFTIQEGWWSVFDEFYLMYLELCR